VASGLVNTEDEHAEALEIIRDRIDAHRDRILSLNTDDNDDA